MRNRESRRASAVAIATVSSLLPSSTNTISKRRPSGSTARTIASYSGCTLSCSLYSGTMIDTLITWTGPRGLAMRCAASMLLSHVVLFAPDMTRSDVLTTSPHAHAAGALKLPTAFYPHDPYRATHRGLLADCVGRHHGWLAHHLQGPS